MITITKENLKQILRDFDNNKTLIQTKILFLNGDCLKIIDTKREIKLINN